MTSSFGNSRRSALAVFTLCALLSLFTTMAVSAQATYEGSSFETEDSINDWLPVTGVLKRTDDNPASGEWALAVTQYRGWVTSRISNLIPIDQAGSYELSARLRVAKGDKDSQLIVGLRFFDHQKKEIFPMTVGPVENTFTTTVADAAVGDESITIKKPAWAQWKPARLHSVIFDAKDDFSDLPNTNYAALKEVKDNGETYELVLSKPLNKAIPSGTAVRQHRYVDYPSVTLNANEKWQTASLKFEGKPGAGASPAKGKFWPTAAYVRINIFVNINFPGSTPTSELPTVVLDDISFRELSNKESKRTVGPQPIETAKADWMIGRKLTLAKGGQSEYVIHHDADAPSTVSDAAEELQRVFEKSAGIRLPIQTDRPATGTPMICLGNNMAAKAAGYSGRAFAYDHFQIVSNGDNIYIFGRDIADGKTTEFGGFSRGTEYGVYEFLESVLGVRWLMPTALGEVIPTHRELKIDPINFRDGPSYAYRAAETKYMGQLDVHGWLRRQRVFRGNNYEPPHVTALPINNMHSWEVHMPAELLEQHPDWQAVEGGKQKFCTNHPEAVKAFIDNAIKWSDAHPDRLMIPIAPSDGQKFCRCDRCEPLVEMDPHGVPSFTYTLLTFYNEVARAFARQRPGKMVSGYIYGRASYPSIRPVQPDPNVFLVWAPLNYYGLGLHKPGYREEFSRVAAQWRQITPNLGYLNYLHWHRSESGAPLAPSLELLELETQVLKDNEFRGVYHCYIQHYSDGGPTNYILSKLLWDADADVQAIYDEWMTLAYGPGAQYMQRIHQTIDHAYQDFKANREPLRYLAGSYEIRAEKIQAIYLPILEDIEKLYFEALDATVDESQRRRLQLFGTQMTIFHYRLREAGYLEQPKQSRFYQTDERYAAFVKQANREGLGIPLTNLGRSEKLAAKPKTFKPLETRTANVPMKSRTSSITIDGVIGSDEWQSAAVLDQFRKVGGSIRANPSTTVKLLADDTHLYVAFICEEPEVAELEARNLTEGDIRIYSGDTAELFIDTDTQDTKYWHLVINPAGSRWAGVVVVPQQGFVWESSAKVDASRKQWTAELAIPFASLGIEKQSGTTLNANIGRGRLTGSSDEYSCWNAVRESFLEPTNFGQWRFE